jgi:ABC-type protease/lipase transport system fused ATPase/permease subunit
VLLAVAIVSLIVNVLMLTVPLYMLQIYGRVLVGRSNETLIYLSIVAVGALLVMAALDFTRSCILAHTSAWLENRLDLGTSYKNITLIIVNAVV